MHRALLFAAYGWLTVGGTLLFSIDVAAQYLRGHRSAGAEATLYYGLNSAFALGQLAFGLLGLWLAWRAPTLLGTGPQSACRLRRQPVGWQFRWSRCPIGNRGS